MASKGQKYKQWTAEEKYKIIKPALDFEKSTSQVTKETGLSNGMINNWIKAYRESGMEGLTPKRKHNNKATIILLILISFLCSWMCLHIGITQGLL